jgi:hypothetical protein
MKIFYLLTYLLFFVFHLYVLMIIYGFDFNPVELY